MGSANSGAVEFGSYDFFEWEMEFQKNKSTVKAQESMQHGYHFCSEFLDAISLHLRDCLGEENQGLGWTIGRHWEGSWPWSNSLGGEILPNLLFYGPPGTGKTSTILAAAHQLFGEHFSARVLELNASDERGIQVIREKVKNFAQLTVSTSAKKDGKPIPPWKLVILDEADSMTNAAQSALRRTMEKETRSTRFCLICNYISRIIEPLTSRCSKFRFKPLSQDIVMQRLKEICVKENVSYEAGVLEELHGMSEGDLRKAITLLQSAARLRPQGIATQDVNEISGFIPPELVEKLLAACQSNSYSRVEDEVSLILLEGYSAFQMILQVHNWVVESPFSDAQKATICYKIAVCDSRLGDGADEFLQLMDLCCTIMRVVSEAG
ncbi:unnamed protein product [Darwinula stevensoni]|uniref:AAA+ ATPase domain-containing protein n=1 Tax=Darwinula stevensoni TaxID=69355 RepID=A0A7R9A5U1_9CRUS|nr:unnamed protein product [Darwinula stevensoni]CAG0892708.1 unnamed protein product [Darwinula stevensoni]